MKNWIVLFTLLTFGSWTGLVRAQCNADAVKLQILGSGGPELDDQRASSSYLVWVNNQATVLVDMGSGSSLNFERSGAKINDLEVVAFSHFHVDHSADFPALVKAAFFSNRTRSLPIYGPDGNKLMPSANEFVQGFFGKQGSYRYLQDYLIADQQGAFWLDVTTVNLNRKQIQSFPFNDGFTLNAIQVHHGPLPALAWRVNTQGCSITFSGDMSNRFQTLVKLAKNSDILVAHNAIPESATGIARNLHMPPSEIGKIAQAVQVKKLILSHRMQRTLGTEKTTLKLIRKFYPGEVLFAEDLDVISPMPNE